MSKKMLLLTALSFVMAGCAGVEIKRVTLENPYAEGLRFYRPYPYLLITNEEGKTGLISKIIYLPNKNEEYAIKVRGGMGSIDAKFTLENGWNLTEYGETKDSKTAEIVTALAGVLRDVKGLRSTPAKDEIGPGLYKLVFDDKTGLISGLEPVIQFK
jgi:hypothetical protein